MKKLCSKIVTIIGLVLTLVGSGAPALAAGATLSLSPATGTFNKGCKFSLQILVDTGGTQTDGTDAILTYDTTRFTATKINSGSIYPDYPGNDINTQAGRITVSGLSSVGSAYSGAGVLATVDFTVLDAAPAGVSQMKFDFDPSNKAKTTDSNVVERGTVADVLNQVTDGSYVVGSGAGCTIGGQRGGPEATPTSIFITQPPLKQPPLPKSGTVENTMIVAGLGGLLVILGIIGLVLL